MDQVPMVRGQRPAGDKAGAILPTEVEWGMFRIKIFQKIPRVVLREDPVEEVWASNVAMVCAEVWVCDSGGMAD